ncbi:hypothetical protein [Selenomonas ruminantium]|uniref:Uncharacterized protein n=1 Tax=Selenomonas ruminantium TaxID=971 RepID=A0A1I0V746_SELRU|nr:hypothetical protein [Selenomonas ruminantium]SFA72098.1 hypothetical protein SAMN05216587_101332 [Selenomonas ruminantium]
MDIQDFVEFLITTIELVVIVILIKIGNLRQWSLLCLDKELDRQSFVIRVLPFYIILLGVLKNGNAELYLIIFLIIIPFFVLMKGIMFAAIIQRGNKTQMKSLTVEMMLGAAVVAELLDLVDAKIYLLLCIRLLLAKDKASDRHNAITA